MGVRIDPDNPWFAAAKLVASYQLGRYAVKRLGPQAALIGPLALLFEWVDGMRYVERSDGSAYGRSDLGKSFTNRHRLRPLFRGLQVASGIALYHQCAGLASLKSWATAGLGLTFLVNGLPVLASAGLFFGDTNQAKYISGYDINNKPITAWAHATPFRYLIVAGAALVGAVGISNRHDLGLPLAYRSPDEYAAQIRAKGLAPIVSAYSPKFAEDPTITVQLGSLSPTASDTLIDLYKQWQPSRNQLEALLQSADLSCLTVAAILQKRDSGFYGLAS